MHQEIRQWLTSKIATTTEIKSYLLHELGHIMTSKNNSRRNLGYQEFTAQKWAINKAKKLKMRPIEKYLIYMAKEWALKNGIVIREYTK